ncbi:hypothetical protein GE115_13040 [Agromyces sp. CFH 90414]|uniref:Uncharacterized protein n=1 Tax=Agromyces agglutinans TaxID=2662258 RepID=A0A6I2FE39_9MICO|nr:hypothetical protein [Agromyces agglutinans]MRG60786.1 hypothetical protein [Agromyces agglutinans]
MPTVRSRGRAVSALVVAGFSATLLTGCFFNPFEAAEQGVEEAIEGATGGEVNLGGELPEGFPAEVPLIEGSITFSGGAGGAEGWIVTIDPSTDAADAAAEAAAALEAAGFAKETAFEGADLGAQIFSNGTYLVLVAGDADALSYTVTPAP